MILLMIWLCWGSLGCRAATDAPFNEQDGTSQPPISDIPKEDAEITMLFVEINGYTLEVQLAQNAATRALLDRLKEQDIVLEVDDYGNFEKVGALGFTLETNDSYFQAQPGDVVLYNGNSLVFFYESNAWQYTKIGKIVGYTSEQLKTVLGAGKGKLQVRLYRPVGESK